MRQWLAIAAVLPLVGATGAQAQMKALTATTVADIARTRALDLRLSQELGNQGSAPLMRGVIVQHDIMRNATIGLGLANIYARRDASDLRIGERPSRSRRPAVTFILKF